MSNPSSQPQVSPSDLLRNIPDAPMRIGAVILSILSLALPLMNVKGAFMDGGSLTITHPLVIGGWSYLLPLMAIALLVVPALDATRHYTKIVGFLFTVTAALLFAIAAYSVWSEIAGASQAQQGVSLLTGSRPPVGMPKLVDVSPSFALATLALCPLVGAYLLWRQR